MPMAEQEKWHIRHIGCCSREPLMGHDYSPILGRARFGNRLKQRQSIAGGYLRE